MPTPAQMCCAAGICCLPGSAEQKKAMNEVEEEFSGAGVDLKATAQGLTKMCAKADKPEKPPTEGL